MNVTDQMRRSATFHSGLPAAIMGERRFSYREAWARGCRMANALIGLGLGPGERVASLEDNGLACVDLFLGAAIANVVRVPLYPRNGREAQIHMMRHTNCRLAVVDEKYAGEVEGLIEVLPDLERIVFRDQDYEAWLAGHDDVDPLIPFAPDDIYIIRHTGGTTGPSKGVAYTHKAWLAAGRDWAYALPTMGPGDKFLHVAPISHASGYLFVPVWLGGGAAVLMDGFNAAGTIETLEREAIKMTFLVPTMINMINTVLLAEREAGRAPRDFSRLECLQTAAAPITDKTALTARELLGDVLYQLYGQTEAVPAAMMGPGEWFAEIEGSEPLRACGRALPFAEIEIWDEANRRLPLGSEGEIVVRCDGQMTGFWNNPEATGERMVDGWVKTGDIGMLDQNGYLYMLDRSNDMIISGGFNIYPAELENVIVDHPAVIEAAVFGVPHEKWGETPMAVCQVAEGAAVAAEEIIRLCADRLGSYKKPAAVEFQTGPLPKSPIGKIMRKDLRAPYWKGRKRRVGGV